MSTSANAMQALLAQQLMQRGAMIGGNQQQGAAQAGGQVAPISPGAALGNSASQAIQQAMLIKALQQQPQQPQMPPQNAPAWSQNPAAYGYAMPQMPDAAGAAAADFPG
jgi:hypothetical protein